MDENATGMEEQYSNYLDLYAKWPWGIANALSLAPLQVASEFGKKTAMGQAEQDPDLPGSASNVLGKVKYYLCLTEWRGKWKCRWGKSTLGAACPAQKIMFCNLCCTL